MSNHHDDQSTALHDEFERLGRKAGAELRTSPPPDGHRLVERTSNSRRVTIATIATVATVAILVAGLVVARHQPHPRPDNQPEETTTSTPTTEAATRGVPGTWRVLADSPLALHYPASATWTGNEAVVLGKNDLGSATISALAYDVGRDQWKQLADPPVALASESFPLGAHLTSWTGSEVLVSTSLGEVFAYNPTENLWKKRTPAKESMGLSVTDSHVAVSPRGVLANSSRGWWWYENATDRWEAIPSPERGVDYSMVDELNADTMVATKIDGSENTITSAIFDIDTRTWRNGPPVGLSSPRGDPRCNAADGLVVCFAEGFGTLQGVVIDPVVGSVGTFNLGNHDNTLTILGIPWFTHAWKLLSPRSATWEDLPSLAGTDSFDAGFWTGSEIVFFGGGNSATPDQRRGTTAAYSPLHRPGT